MRGTCRASRGLHLAFCICAVCTVCTVLYCTMRRILVACTWKWICVTSALHVCVRIGFAYLGGKLPCVHVYGHAGTCAYSRHFFIFSL